jgi:hypothetical protein
MQLLQMLPLILLFIFTLTSFQGFGGGEDKFFELRPVGSYTEERRTVTASITPDLPFLR